MQLTNNKILITGGASGIGLGLTGRFLLEGNTVIVCGRREAVLQEVADKHPSIITKVCDLANEADRAALYEWIATEHSDLNVLVNNAGIQQWMDITADDFFARAKNELVTNIEWLRLHLMSLFIKDTPALNTIINVTSGLSFVPFTKVPVYSATKAFFHSYTQSARYLLRLSKGIEVIELIPPALNTDLGGKGLHDHAPPVSDFIASIFEQLKQGKTEAAFGFAEERAKVGAAEWKVVFDRLNP